jgi:hypothetical protein
MPVPVVPVIMQAAPAALEILKVFLTADENARRHEVAKMEHHLNMMRQELELSRLDHDRELLSARVLVFTNLLEVAKSSFDKKAELYGAIQSSVLQEYALDKRALERDRDAFLAIVRDHDALPDRLAAAHRELARIEDRARQLDRQRAKLLKQFQATILALAPGDFTQVRHVIGIV